MAVVKCFWMADYIALAVVLTACFDPTLREECNAAECRTVDGLVQLAAGVVDSAVE